MVSNRKNYLIIKRNYSQIKKTNLSDTKVGGFDTCTYKSIVSVKFYQELLLSSMDGDLVQQHLRNLQSGSSITTHFLKHPYCQNSQEFGESNLWKG